MKRTIEQIWFGLLLLIIVSSCKKDSNGVTLEFKGPFYKEEVLKQFKLDSLPFNVHSKDLYIALVKNNSNETITLESDCLLAYDSTVNTDIEFSGVNGIVSGQGLFTTTVTGCGNISIISDGELIALEVTPQNSLHIDPDAFIAFKGDLLREFILDVNWKTMAGQASGESYQIKFSGSGVVYIQPSER